MNRFVGRILFLFFLFPFLWTCSLFDAFRGFERNFISLPNLPGRLENLFDRLSVNGAGVFFEIKYFKDGKLKIGRVEYGRRGYIEMDRGLNLPVICKLMVRINGKDVLSFKEGGGISPFDAVKNPDGSVLLRLSWARGAVAKMFMEMRLAGVGVERINTARLYTEIDKLKLDDPWLLDWRYVKYRLSRGTFRVTYLKILESYRFSLRPDSVEGEVWYLNTPFSDAYTVNKTEGVSLFLIPGFYTLFSVSGNHFKCFDLSVNYEGELEIFPRVNTWFDN